MIIGLDVGGTHTDAVLLGDEGVIRSIKVPTDQSDLFATVLAGIENITDGIDIGLVRRAVLSTTLTTNAIAENKIPPVGMIVSAGPGIDPACFRTNEQYVVVAGAIDHRGREIEPLDTRQVEAAAETFRKSGIQNVGVVSKFSPRNPAHELTVFRHIEADFEQVFMGHRISGQLNFPRRVATTYLNAAVYPIHRKFFLAVKQSLVRKGLDIPIHILKADGGTMSVDASVDFPGQTILSGPAASIMGALAFSFEGEDCLVLDIGGTTTDIAVLVNRSPVLSPLGIEIGPYKTLIRALETRSIGVGGDSAVRVRGGRLSVGPDRLGPPLAHGGPGPTPTDALSILGQKKTGDRERALAGFAPLAADLGLSAEETARRVLDQVCEAILAQAATMIDRLNRKPVYTVHEIRDGFRIQPEKMLVLGGPAHHFAGHLERLSKYKVGVVPRWKVANAVGAALARTTCEVTFFADTQLGRAGAPEEDFSCECGRGYTREKAVESAFDLLRKKAIRMGARIEDLELEILEDLQFNMVRGFSTTGKNIRIRAQVRPGLVSEYDVVAGLLSTAD
jgi:N-methylhydantoinase A/oxoprolinase/acetone carboxylase beta subunit